MHVSAIARTYAHALDRKQYSQTQTQTQTHANKRTQTIAAIDTWVISACKRDAFCALDLKLSGCTIAAAKQLA